MRPLVVLAAGLLLLQGCAGQLAQTTPSASTTPLPKIDKLSGEQVARMAEQQLEAMHPGMAPGRMTCPDLRFTTSASVRCKQVAELSEGRRVEVLGTVTVTSTDNGGNLHVKLDDSVVEFGVTGTYLAEVLAKQIARPEVPAPKITCPYLPGRVGAKVTCRYALGKVHYRAAAEVTSVEPGTNTTHFRFHLEDEVAVQRSLPYVATKPSAVVDLPGDHAAAA